MTTLKELVAQKEALEAQIAQAIKHEKSDAISKVKALIKEYSLTESDVFGGAGKGEKKAKADVAPKYRDPESGQTWSGRGRMPKWLSGKDLSQFAV